MEINSITTLSKDIVTTKINEFGEEVEHALAFVTASINQTTLQCMFNIQVFERDEYGKYKEEINDGISDFLNGLSTYTRSADLTFLDAFKR